jgi:hypothetical protein
MLVFIFRIDEPFLFALFLNLYIFYNIWYICFVNGRLVGSEGSDLDILKILSIDFGFDFVFSKGDGIFELLGQVLID